MTGVQTCALPICFPVTISAGGQLEGVDFNTVSPYRLGRGLFNRVVGLLGKYLDVESMAQ